METEIRLSVQEARSEMIRSLVKVSIGWTLVLTAAVVGAVFAVNSQFDALESQFDRKFDALESKLDRKIDVLQNLILQHITLHPESQDAAVSSQPVDKPKLTG